MNRLLATLAAAAVTGTAFATAPPEERPLEGVAILNGGIGLDESTYMKSRIADYPLAFVLSGRGGEYAVADRLTLRQGGREVVSVDDAGPYLLLRVPPGRYTVHAAFDGVVETRSVTVGSAATRVHWTTPNAH